MKKTAKTLCFILTFVLLLTGQSFTTAAGGQSVSQGQKNIVLRARQLTEIRWTPLYDRWQWGYGGLFSAGTTYTGVPYGQPVETGYIGFDITLDEFAAAVRDPGSAFYSSYSWYNKIAPAYSIDCSGFVSYAWGLSSRQNTTSLPEVAEYVADQSIGALEVGDCLNKSGVHAVLVSDVLRSASGQVTSVEIMEATPGTTAVTRYGTGGSRTLAQLQSRYFDSGYVLYRYPGRYSVSYVHSCAVPLDGDTCARCAGSGGYSDVSASAWYAGAVDYVSGAGLFRGTGGSAFSPEGSMTRGMFVTVLGRLAGLPEGLSGRIGIALGDNVNLRAGAGTSNAVLGQVHYGDVLSILGWENGWYKVKSGGTVGYVIEDYVKAYTGAFTDLDESAYYSPYVQWAYLTGVCQGTGGGRFSAESAVSREDMAVLLYNYSRCQGLGLSAKTTVTGFTDQASIDPAKSAAVSALQRAGILAGMGDGSFAPKKSATRAQVAQIIWNFARAV
ncbi:MAG: S-layer homology domain-containing protein [Oscillospiraceae bacterium]